MRPLLTPEQMRQTEARYFAGSGVPSIDLMERAAERLAAAVRPYAAAGPAYFACGTGGNGGDGLAAARMLRQAGIEAHILLPAPPRSADARENLRRAEAAGVPVHAPEAFDGLPEPGVWCDALFGIGLSRAPEGEAARLIRRMNASDAPTVAADVPSGLDALTGRAFEPCVRAAETVSFQCLKTGLLLGDGLDACGKISAADIGIPADLLPPEAVLGLEPGDVGRLLRPRPRNMHKGTAGHLLLVAGSFGMAGAASLAATAALRVGAGLVTVACPASIVPILQTLCPCAVCLPLPETDGALNAEAAAPLRAALKGKTAIAAGCGLSQRASPEVLRVLLESGLPAVLDADALNLIALHPELKTLLGPEHILTPHPGEAARLLGRMPEDPLSGAAALRALGPVAVYKGAATVIAGAHTYVSSAGTSGMARGGSGDTLTGIMGALLAEGLNPDAPEAERMELTAALACQIHGLAGEAAAARHTSRAMTAMDLAREGLEEVFRRWGP